MYTELNSGERLPSTVSDAGGQHSRRLEMTIIKSKVRYVVAIAAFAALTTLGAGTAAYAHHAFAAEFDSEAPVLLKGPVQAIEWYNPHAWIHIKVQDTDGTGKAKPGTTFNWAIEGG